MSDTSRGQGPWLARGGVSYPSGPVPAPAPLTGKKSLARRPVSWAVLAVAVVALVVAVVLVGHGRNEVPASSAGKGAETATGNGASARSTASGGVPTTPTAASRTLLSLHGSGFASLSPFTVPTSAKGWLLHYLFNCAPTGSSGNFAIYVDDAAGLTTGVAANELALQGGSTYYSDSRGTYALQINSQCNWAAVVQTIPQ